MVEIDVAGVRLALLAQRAAYLIDERCLLVADAHIGKAVSFRRLGVPVPSGTTSQTLQVLSQAIAATGARRVVFLGDLLHSAHAHATATLQALAQWRHAHAHLELLLVRGNHDDRAGDPPPTLGVDSVDEPLRMGGWRCATTRSRAPGPMCWPAICTPAWYSAAARTSGCACRVSTSASTSACCRPSAPSPACMPSAPAPASRSTWSETTWCSRCREPKTLN